MYFDFLAIGNWLIFSKGSIFVQRFRMLGFLLKKKQFSVSQIGKMPSVKLKLLQISISTTFRILGFQPLYKTASFWANKQLSAIQKGKILWEKLKLLQISISSIFGILGFQPLYKTACFWAKKQLSASQKGKIHREMIMIVVP